MNAVDTAHEQRREALAKLLAAAKMGMILDPTGDGLPDDLWQQCLPEADAVLLLLVGPVTAPA